MKQNGCAMNKTFALITGSLLASQFPGVAFARDTILHLQLAEVLAMSEAKAKLDGSVIFFLAGVAQPAVQKQLGTDVSNRKTNGVGKSDEEACRWAALSALLAFQESAKQRGANAVVNLVSYYKKQTFQSSTEYECHAGGIIVGVAFKGDYATVAR
jgi:uncharacterized protein YbjQ (UPF0145 family)